MFSKKIVCKLPINHYSVGEYAFLLWARKTHDSFRYNNAEQFKDQYFKEDLDYDIPNTIALHYLRQWNYQMFALLCEDNQLINQSFNIGKIIAQSMQAANVFFKNPHKISNIIGFNDFVNQKNPSPNRLVYPKDVMISINTDMLPILRKYIDMLSDDKCDAAIRDFDQMCGRSKTLKNIVHDSFDSYTINVPPRYDYHKILPKIINIFKQYKITDADDINDVILSHVGLIILFDFVNNPNQSNVQIMINMLSQHRLFKSPLIDNLVYSECIQKYVINREPLASSEFICDTKDEVTA